MHSVHLAVLMTSHDHRARTLSALRALEGQRGLPRGRRWACISWTPAAALRYAGGGAAAPSGGGGHVGGPRRLPQPGAAHREPEQPQWRRGRRPARRSPGRAEPRVDASAVARRRRRAVPGRPRDPLHTSETAGACAVVVGAERNAYGDTVYSGRRGRSLTLVEPGAHRPRALRHVRRTGRSGAPCAYDVVGDPDRVFRHRMGDYDHGRRARRAGAAVLVAPGHAGECVDGPAAPGSREPGIGVREALRRVTSVRELPPRQWWAYCLRHTWPWAPYLMVSRTRAQRRAPRSGGCGGDRGPGGVSPVRPRSAASAGRPLGGGGTVGCPAAVLAAPVGAPRPGAELLTPVAGVAAGIAAPASAASVRRPAVVVRSWVARDVAVLGRGRTGGARTGRAVQGRGVRRDPQQGVHGGGRPGERQQEERRVQQLRIHEGPGGHGHARPQSGQDRGARHGHTDPAQPVRDVVVRGAQRGTRDARRREIRTRALSARATVARSRQRGPARRGRTGRPPGSARRRRPGRTR